MEKSMFEAKTKEAIKPIEEICEKLVSCTKAHLDKGIEDVDAKEMGYVVDMIKDLSEAKHYIVEAMYKTTVGTAMEENADSYGEEWDENGLKGYRGQRRDSRGRYMYTARVPEVYRDMDRPQGRMYYAEGMSTNGNSAYNTMRNYPTMSESRFDIAKRNYTESKAMHNSDTEMDNEKNAQEAGKWIDEIVNEIKPMIPEMKAQERSTMKAKLMGLANSL